ncbi:methyltransferase domain-containing protein [Sulfurovum mangrovi]|uniref:methyltransferase domain-containing protein n=1 Tax=Sulfurovum mangrovi TaxID=2893889 RepID=UPI001E6186EE|nr:class I SAM-dependent methyltransferase [Sulfurovum mangrovi]UFH60747.1 class I SAM-dependent methyltransferase [Sulfurovum mangrovi]
MPTNTSDSLDLYAKVEDLLGIEEATPRLYAHYLLFLQSIQPKTLLDVGCGSGDFLLQMQKALKLEEAKGIDLSPLMVERTKMKGWWMQSVSTCAILRANMM